MLVSNGLVDQLDTMLVRYPAVIVTAERFGNVIIPSISVCPYEGQRMAELAQRLDTEERKVRRLSRLLRRAGYGDSV